MRPSLCVCAIALFAAIIPSCAPGPQAAPAPAPTGQFISETSEADLREYGAQ